MPTPYDEAPNELDEEIARRQADLAVALDDVRTTTNLLQRRLATIECDYARLGEAVALRSRAAAVPRETASAPPPAARRPVEPAQRPARAATPAPAAAVVQAPERRRARTGLVAAVDRLVTASYADLFGARLLAWAGGAVTALGIVLLFVFAVNRGWIGPELRVALGGLASTAIFGAGLELRRRYGTTYAALGAVGAGIAGGYATLLAAAVLYELVSGWAALLVAGAVAAVGAATAIAWRAEIVAGIGLVGAMIVPLAAVPDSGLTVLGAAFVAIVFAGTAGVATHHRWPRLLTVGLLVSFPQAALLLADGDARPPSLVAATAAFTLLYAAAGVAFQRVVDLQSVSRLPATLVLASALVAVLGAAVVTGEGAIGAVDREGLVLALVALGYAGAAAALYGLARAHALGILFAAVALAVGGHALAELFSGRTLAVAFAVQAVLLAWLAQWIADRRLALGALAYLAAAGLHAVVVDAPASDLTEPQLHPAFGAPSLLAFALAAVGVARYSGVWQRRAVDAERLGFIDRAALPLGGAGGVVRMVLGAAAGAAALYAGALGVLEAGQLVGDEVVTSFEWSHATVSALVALAGLLALELAARRWPTAVTAAALACFSLAAGKAATFDLERLADTPRAVSALVVGVTLAVGALSLLVRRPSEGGRDALAAVPLCLAVPLELVGALLLTGDAAWRGVDGDGLALAALGVAHVALGALAYPRRHGRDHSTAQGAIGLVLAGAAIHQLVDGTPRAVALAATGAFLAALAVAVHERRLLAGALAYTGLAGVYALALEAPPGHLFTAQAHPGIGVPALLALLVAAVALAAAERRTDGTIRRLPAAVEAALADWRRRWLWASGALAVYATSLGLLEAAEVALAGSVHEDFQRGHAIVSAFWAIVGVASLRAGLVRHDRALRAAAFAALAATLVKIFVYDVATLSAAARAASFLAVGVLLLAAGFFYQRLSAAPEERRAGNVA